jgi:hypothetical protein
MRAVFQVAGVLGGRVAGEIKKITSSLVSL